MGVDSAWWVYLILCSDGSLYCGISTDVERRFAEHRAGRGARYFRGRQPEKVVYQEACANRADASRREAAIKRLPRAVKWGLAGGAPGDAGRPERGSRMQRSGVASEST